ncbi:MAG: hypothetical protein AAFV33_00140, partial [Chloroflexota bacterium]
EALPTTSIYVCLWSARQGLIEAPVGFAIVLKWLSSLLLPVVDVARHARLSGAAHPAGIYPPQIVAHSPHNTKNNLF